MGVTKIEQYEREQIALANTLKVLGHPARLSILRAISKTNACICGDLVTEIGLAQSTISQHLKELKAVGLIKGTVEGTSVCYCIDNDSWLNVQNQLSEFLNQTGCDDTCC